MSYNEIQPYEDNQDITNYNTQSQYGDTAIDVARTMKEVEASIILSKKFPRDINKSISRIVTSCQRASLAQLAIYSYPRGGENVSGPSIRLAEVLAQNYGNIQFGIREISSENRESLVEAWTWDVETNTRVSKTFRVPHQRKAYGKIKTLTDPRDIYELVANQGARRLRACILAVIPQDITEMALEECRKTLTSSDSKIPLIDRIRRMVIAFDQLGVKQEHIEKKLGHPVDNIDKEEIVNLLSIYNSIKDGIGKREDYFEIKAETQSEAAEYLNKKQVEKDSASDKPEKLTKKDFNLK